MPSVEIIDLHFQSLEHAIAAYLVRTSDGPVLIETGPHSTLPVLTKELAKLKVKLSDIKHVLLTHIHLDHAGAAWTFAQSGANIYLHPFGSKNMQDPSRLITSARQIYKDQMDLLWGKIKPIPHNQLIQVAHNEVISIGEIEIRSLHTPGHAKHHIAWQMDEVIFTGDVAGVKIGEGLVQPPCPPPDINIEHWKDSIGLIRAQNPKRLYLTHYGFIEEVDGHLLELEKMLENWSFFVKAMWLNEMSNEEIVPLFMEHTTKQMKANGLSPSQIKRYQAANPAWMSVAGLTRYWTKQSNNLPK